MKDTKNTSENDILTRVIVAASLILIALHLLAAFFPNRWLWGVYHSATIAPALVVLLALLATVACIPKLNSFAIKAFKNFTGRMASKLDSSSVLFGIMIPVGILAVAAFTLRQENFLMGDGYTLLRNILEKEMISTTAPLTRLFNLLLVDIFRVENSEGARWVFFITSVIAGIIYFLSAHAFFKLVFRNKTKIVVGLLIVITAPVVQLFLGYVENYPLLHAWIVLFIYICTLRLRNRVSSLACAFAFAIGVGLHVSFAALLPALIWVLFFSSDRSRNNLFYSLSIAFVVTAYVVGVTLSRTVYKFFLLPFPTSDTSYFLFSPHHIVDVVNILLLMVPILIFVFGLQLYFRLSKKETPDRTQRFLTYMSLAGLAFIFFIDPTIGAIRDWDLLSLATTPIIFSSLYFLLKRTESSIKLATVALPILAICIWHTGAWVYSNMDQQRAIDLMLDPLLQDTHYTRDYHNGDRLVPLAVVVSNGVKDDILAEELALERLSIDSTDVIAMDILQIIYRNRKDMNSACEILGRMVAEMPDDDSYRLLYGMILVDAGRYEDAMPQLRTVGENSQSYNRDFYLGNAYSGLQQYDSALVYYKSAYKDAPGDFTLTFRIGMTAAAKGDFKAALVFFRKCLQATPDNPELLLRIGQDFQSMHQFDSARIYYKKSYDIDPERLETLSSLAFIFMETGHPEQSIKWWRKCITVNPQYTVGYFIMGKIQDSIGKQNEALALWKAAIETAPEFIPALSQTALLYDRIGETDSAESYLHRIAEIDSTAFSDPIIGPKLNEYGITKR